MWRVEGQGIRHNMAQRTMGAIHKMAPVGVCGALLHTGACRMYGWLRAAEKKLTFGTLLFAPFA